VLDTSVLLADPRALIRFDEHAVVLPIVVLMELEAKRDHPELGWSARQTLRHLERLRLEHGSLTEPLPVNEHGGTLPPAMTTENNDHRILAVAHNLSTDGFDVTVVTKDLPLRLKASIVGLAADEYRNELASDASWNGYLDLDVEPDDIDELFAEKSLDLREARELPVNAGVALHAGTQSALGRVRADKAIHLVRGDLTVFDVAGRSAEQRIALDILRGDRQPRRHRRHRQERAGPCRRPRRGVGASHPQANPRVPAAIRGGRPGAGLPARRQGREDGAVGRCGPRRPGVDRRPRGGRGGVRPGAARGAAAHPHPGPEPHRQAQNLEKAVLLTALSRLGEGSRVVLTHDVAQRDNLRVGRHDGIASVIDAMKGHPLFAHVTFTRSERSPVAALVTGLLDDPTT
jgi:PhoH-like ATPase